MILYKVWNTKHGRWLVGGLVIATSARIVGKLWTGAGYLKSAITHRLPSEWTHKKYPGPAAAHVKGILDDNEVVIYELVELERVPLREWYERNR